MFLVRVAMIAVVTKLHVCQCIPFTEGYGPRFSYTVFRIISDRLRSYNIRRRMYLCLFCERNVLVDFLVLTFYFIRQPIEMFEKFERTFVFKECITACSCLTVPPPECVLCTWSVISSLKFFPFKTNAFWACQYQMVIWFTTEYWWNHVGPLRME